MTDSNKNELKLNQDILDKIQSDIESNIKNEDTDSDNSDLKDNPGINPDNKQKKEFPLWIVLLIIGVIVAAAVIFYIYKANTYKTVFFPNTVINGIDASERTPDAAREDIRNQCREYSIVVESKGRNQEEIKASDIGMEYVAGEELDSILMEQKSLMWIFEMSKPHSYDIPTLTKLDDTKLLEACNNLKAFDDSSAEKPVNASLGEYDPSENEYLIIAENDGNIITDKNKAVEIIRDSILTMKPQINLEETGRDIYSKADVRSDNEKLIAQKTRLDTFVKPKIKYIGYDIVLDGNLLKDWMVESDDGSLTVDENKLRNFVSDLALVYDTKGKERTLVTQYGNTTTVSDGDFGWTVDQEAEFNELKKILKEGKDVEREPVFSTKGISHGDNDWGDTYVEINLAKQHLFFVKDGKLIVSSDLVSGGHQRRTPTPTGVYSVKLKARNVVLRGPRRADGSYQWESPVSYWMPFNKGIGLHDAKWRGSFGGNIYKTNGSHGCVNLPIKKATKIYEEIKAGIPVIVYDDDFVVMNMPPDPEEEQKRIEKEKLEEQKKIEEEAKKAIKVPDPKKSEKKTAQKKSEPVQPQTQAPVPAQPETVAAETSADIIEHETAPESWGPAFENKQIETPEETAPETAAAESSASSDDTTVVYPIDVTTGIENVPGDT